MQKFQLGLILMILGLALMACSTEEKVEPTQERVTLPTFPPSLTLATATPLPLPIAMNDERFPIQPDPSGKTLYETHCAQCHGINGEGQNPADPYAPDANGLMVAPPHNNNGHTWHHPDQQNFLAVWGGRQVSGFNPMPSFQSQLSVDEIFQVLAYIKTFWGEDELEAQTNGTLAQMEG